MFSIRAIKHAGSFGGFTLLEVVVAMTVLSTGIIGVLAAFSAGRLAASGSSRLEEAVTIAQRELELALTIPAAELKKMNGSSGRYTWTLTFADKPHDLMLCSIVVRWQQQGQTEVYRLSQVFVPRR